MKKLIAALILALAVVPAKAADWLEFSSDKDGTVYIDADTFQVLHDRRIFWTRIVVKGGERYAEVKHHADCSRKTMGVERIEVYEHGTLKPVKTVKLTLVMEAPGADKPLLDLACRVKDSSAVNGKVAKPLGPGYM